MPKNLEQYELVKRNIITEEQAKLFDRKTLDIYDNLIENENIPILFGIAKDSNPRDSNIGLKKLAGISNDDIPKILARYKNSILHLLKKRHMNFEDIINIESEDWEKLSDIYISHRFKFFDYVIKYKMGESFAKMINQNQIFIYAYLGKTPEILNYFEQHLNNISSDEIRHIIKILSIKHEHKIKDIFEFLSIKDISKALIAAKDIGYIDIITQLVTSKNADDISLEALELCLSYPISEYEDYGYVSNIIALNNAKYLSTNSLAIAYKKAFYNSDQNTMNEIVSILNRYDIPSEKLVNSISKLKEANSHIILDLILNLDNANQIELNILKTLFIEARTEKKAIFAKVIINHINRREISAFDLYTILIELIDKADIDSASMILEHTSMKNMSLLNLLEIYSKAVDLDIENAYIVVDKIINIASKSKIGENILSIYLNYEFENNNFTNLSFLLKFPNIKEIDQLSILEKIRKTEDIYTLREFSKLVSDPEYNKEEFPNQIGESLFNVVKMNNKNEQDIDTINEIIGLIKKKSFFKQEHLNKITYKIANHIFESVIKLNRSNNISMGFVKFLKSSYKEDQETLNEFILKMRHLNRNELNRIIDEIIGVRPILKAVPTQIITVSGGPETPKTVEYFLKKKKRIIDQQNKETCYAKRIRNDNEIEQQNSR